MSDEMIDVTKQILLLELLFDDPTANFTVGPSTTPEEMAAALSERLEPDFLAQVVAILTDALGQT
jgi:hypothetical protein